MGQVYITEIAAVLELSKVISFNFVCFVRKSSVVSMTERLFR